MFRAVKFESNGEDESCRGDNSSPCGIVSISKGTREQRGWIGLRDSKSKEHERSLRWKKVLLRIRGALQCHWTYSRATKFYYQSWLWIRLRNLEVTCLLSKAGPFLQVCKRLWPSQKSIKFADEREFFWYETSRLNITPFRRSRRNTRTLSVNSLFSSFCFWFFFFF